MYKRQPILLKAFNVAKLSSPSKKPETFVIPLLIEPSMFDRCEIDLSPGTLIEPLKVAQFEVMKFDIG